jgi:oxygen-dependent protoporphyrinogen oxidase
MPEDRARRVAIVGGGIGGLAAAYELTRSARDQGVSLTLDLFESRDRLGGVILTEREGDYILDAGPDAILTLKPAALELCRELGLGDEIIPTRDEHRGVALYSRGKLRSLPYGTGSSWTRKIAAYASSGVVSWGAKLRMAGDLFLPRGPVGEDESMAEFFGRRLGREAVERIIDPLIAGIYSGDPDKLSIYSTFPRFPQIVAKNRSLLLTMLKTPQSARSGGRTLPVFCSLREGLGQLVDALAERLDGAEVFLDTEVRSVRRTAYRRSDVGDGLRGYGFLIPNCEGRRINGATWISNKFEHRSPEDGFLARCFVGGDRTAEELEKNDDELIRICRDELREIAGITAEPVFSRVYRWKESNPQYDVGHAHRSRGIDDLLSEHPGLHVSGSGFRGIGLPDCVRDGRDTARRLLGVAG